MAESRRDAVEGVELAQQQSREPALLTLTQKLLDEPNARVRLLAEAAFLLSFGHGSPMSLLLGYWERQFEAESLYLQAVRGITTARW